MQRTTPRTTTGRRLVLLAGALALVAAACSSLGSSGETPATAPSGGALDPAYTAPPPPALDQERVSRGEDLYQQNCASCHKADRSGAPNWKLSNEAGVFPPPPHDNSGHTWHHPDDLLIGIVLDGIDGVPSAMPKFRGRLTEDEVVSILEFFKSKWGEDERAFQWQVTWQSQQ